MSPVSILILAAYASLLLELVVFPIPSEASTYQLFTGGDEGESDALQRARRRSSIGKLLLYFLPTALGVGLFLVPLVAAFVPAIIDRLLPLEMLERGAFVAGGAALVVLGRLVTFTSVLQLRRRHGRPETFAARGWFRISRNPGLVGMYLFYLGNCLLFPCVVLFLGFVPYVWNMHRRVVMEESHLARVLGEEYAAYRARVPRYVSWGFRPWGSWPGGGGR